MSLASPQAAIKKAPDQRRILFLGDIVGRAARSAVIDQIAEIRQQYQTDAIVVNCENAAGGFGVTPEICDRLFEAGIDVLTTGNHVFDKAEISPYLSRQPHLLRPLNMDAAFPGKGSVIVTLADGFRLGVVNVMCNLFMAENDNAFAAMEKQMAKMALGTDADAIVVDVHGEATSEKMAMGHFLDGRVSLVVGTHTHIPTADHQILTGGTAYLTDAGMCGNYDSVIGMDKIAATSRFTGRRSKSLSVANGTPSLCGVLVDVAPSGLATQIMPFRRGGAIGIDGDLGNRLIPAAEHR